MDRLSFGDRIEQVGEGILSGWIGLTTPTLAMTIIRPLVGGEGGGRRYPTEGEIESCWREAKGEQGIFDFPECAQIYAT